MNVTLLIDAIVQQTTVLIAQLATSSGTRAPLSHTANQVFVDLVRELKAQGLGNKVIADMFGLALRTYHNKVQRLSESSTFQGRSLWNAVLEYVQEQGTVTRAQVLRRFQRDDQDTVRSVLADLVDSQLVFRTGRGDATTFRAVSDEDRQGSKIDERDSLANLLWVAIHRYGPVDRDELLKRTPAEPQAVDDALQALLDDGRAALDGGKYRSDEIVIPVGDSAGWEAAVFDHYQAMVTAICAKLRTGGRQGSADDAHGGSTYTYDVWEGHPHQPEVQSFLRESRARAVALRRKVEAYNEGHGAPSEDARQTFIAYVGQTVLGAEEQTDE